MGCGPCVVKSGPPPLLVSAAGFSYVGSPARRHPLAESPMEPAAPADVPSTRRRFLARVSIALSSLIAAVAGVPVIAFLLSPLTRKAPRVWRAVGSVDRFAVGETVSVAFEDASP